MRFLKSHAKLLALLSICCLAVNCNDENESLTCNDDKIPKIEIKEIQIGNQIWMANNLDVFTETGSWYYNNSCAYSQPNGRLYLWEFAMNGAQNSSSTPSGVQGLCPEGWHIPSQDEWQMLCDHLNSLGLNANDLKSTDSLLWPSPHLGTNSTNFNAVPTGTVFNEGTTSANIDVFVSYLSTTLDEQTGAPYAFDIRTNSSEIVKSIPVGYNNAWSVRCVKN